MDINKKGSPAFDGTDQRVGYDPVTYFRDPSTTQIRIRKSTRLESSIGSLMAGAGAIWTAYLATSHFTSMSRVSVPPGPLELSGLGILIWLHAKWRGR